MKKLIYSIITLALAATVGCTPSEEQVNKTATAIGYAAGLVANQVGIKDDARNAVVDVLTEVRECIPEEGQSFEDAWTPIITEKVDALVKAGKIDAATGELVKTVAVMAAKGVDYLFDVRYPKAKKYEELVRAGASGAIDGFLTVFTPAECDDCEEPSARSAKKQVECDKEAYEYFQKNWKK